ncbi:hypothetical protein [Chryseobacterium sp. GP-SGM7]|uniref:hypothetical protein n=1 Tax=Chryseobacterium sp. GP-SGM7 TaxID=3411323 RepID=UPI003B95CC57
MYKYCLIFFLLIFSCKEKNSFEEISINENIIKEIKADKKSSKEPRVYIVSLFTDKGENICEIIRYKEVSTSTNFIGCQLLESDTILLYVDKKNKFSDCYKLSNRYMHFNKKQFVIRDKKEIGYYKLDTLNCSMKKFKPNLSDL